MTDSTSNDMTATPRMPGGPLPRFDTPLVPRNSISGRALIAVSYTHLTLPTKRIV